MRPCSITNLAAGVFFAVLLQRRPWILVAHHKQFCKDIFLFRSVMLSQAFVSAKEVFLDLCRSPKPATKSERVALLSNHGQIAMVGSTEKGY